MIVNEQIKEIISKIVINYNPDKIILFGSYARVEFNEDSDLDLIIIKNSNLPKHKRGLEVRRLFYGLPIPMDIKIYTWNEFVHEIKNQYSFLSTALIDSKVIYERQS